MQFSVFFRDCFPQTDSHGKPWVPLALLSSSRPGKATSFQVSYCGSHLFNSVKKAVLPCWWLSGTQWRWHRSGWGSGLALSCCPKFNLILATFFIVQLRESWVTGKSGRGVAPPLCEGCRYFAQFSTVFSNILQFPFLAKVPHCVLVWNSLAIKTHLFKSKNLHIEEKHPPKFYF